MVGRAVLTSFDALALEVHDPCTCGHIEIGILSSLRQVMLHPFDFTDCRVRCRNPCSIFLGLKGWFIRPLAVAKKERSANPCGSNRCAADPNCQNTRPVAPLNPEPNIP